MAEQDLITFSRYERNSSGNMVAVFEYRYPYVDYVWENDGYSRVYRYETRFDRGSLETRYRNLTQAKYDATLTHSVLAGWPEETA